ncbi:MAG: Na+/H+ antiporter NhaA [Bacteroidales bacterium]|jgi:NhaA family Na+:H+ antiporter|nr:Na+/H+ antiporter NhaA [Bacteroidales bacterium]
MMNLFNKKRNVEAEVDPALRILRRNMRGDAMSGIILLVSTFVALAVANTHLYHWYEEFLNLHVSFNIGAFCVDYAMHEWINDGLMVVFFLLVTLEIKRESMIGVLSSPKKAMLPIIAAIGGMVVPVLIFVIFNKDPEVAKAWAIPMATDIAFSLGILSLLGKRVPLGLKVFLTAFAIADDLGAVLVIVFFYSSAIDFMYLGIAFGGLALLVLANRLNVRVVFPYILVGFLVWYFMLESGVHSTIAGVLVGLTIPMKSTISTPDFFSKMRSSFRNFMEEENNTDKKHDNIMTKDQLSCLDNISSDSRRVLGPLQNLEHGLHNFSAFVDLPLFAFANTGVRLVGNTELKMSVFPFIIMIALVLGKTLGVFSFSMIAHKLKIVEFPKELTAKALLGMGILGGIGFTMSLFIAMLSFDPGMHLDQAKIGILGGSFFSGILGYFYLKLFVFTDKKEKKK